MSYTRTTWVSGAAPGISAANLNNIEDGIEQNNLFRLLLTPGRYKVTEFDTPTTDNITETIRDSGDHSVIATLVTEFDTPSGDDITVTLTCSDLGIQNVVVIEFDTPTTDNITETSTEVT